MMSGLALALAGLLAPLYASAVLPAVPEAPGERLARWLAIDGFVVIWLVVGVAAIARYRFFNEQNIQGAGFGRDDDTVRRMQAVLQNTLEQVVLATFAHGAWLFAAPAGWRSVAYVYVVYFCVGRGLFFANYQKGAGARALGFALTFYPSVAMLLGALVFAVAGMVR